MSKCSCGVVPGDCYDACGARESKISDLIRERDALAELPKQDTKMCPSRISAEFPPFRADVCTCGLTTSIESALRR
jgi:hypothetical protein